MIPKDQEGQPKRPGGTFGRRGTLSRGSPQDNVLQKNAQTITAPARRNGKRFDSLARFSLWMNQEWVMPQFFQNCGRGDIRGRPAGRRSFFLGCARGAKGLEFRFLRKARRGAAPPPCQPFEKRLDRKLALLTLVLCGVSAVSASGVPASFPAPPPRRPHGVPSTGEWRASAASPPAGKSSPASPYPPYQKAGAT